MGNKNEEGIETGLNPETDPQKNEKGNTPEKTEEKCEDKKVRICILYPYKPTADDGYGLRQSIRSLEKHLMLDTPYDFEPEVVVVGSEKPSWLKEENFIESKRQCRNAQEARMVSISAYFEKGDCAEKIILMSDDMFIINDIILADIEVLKANGFLPESDETAMLLRKNDNPIYDYETHLPCIMETKIVKQIFSELEEGSDPSKLRLRSLYFNTIFNKIIPIILNWKEDNWVLPIANISPNMAIVDAQIKKSKFMFFRNGAYGEPNKKLIGELFDTAAECEMSF